jgi:hypothetical protein
MSRRETSESRKKSPETWLPAEAFTSERMHQQTRRSPAVLDLPLPPRHPGPARAEGEVNDTDARLWLPWLRINRVLRVMLHTRWSAEAWTQVRVEFREARALRSQIRRAGWFN